jgi:YbgC/YbaW family acyl-CoA thioester hydrolase
LLLAKHLLSKFIKQIDNIYIPIRKIYHLIFYKIEENKMFSVKRRINFYDCDPAGIIFFSRIFEFCHAAYETLIESFELDEDYWDNPYYVVPIIHSECDYYKPIKYGDEIEIEVFVSQLKSSSFELNYKINFANETCALVKTVHVFVRREDWNKMQIPDNIMIGLQKNLSE